jgi:hypothetical protein
MRKAVAPEELMTKKELGYLAETPPSSETNDVIIWNMAPYTDSSEMGQSDHFAQFYESDAYLMNALSAFVSAGLNTGETVIVVATQKHRDSLEVLLNSAGLNVAAASASGQYLALDAAELLAKLRLTARWTGSISTNWRGRYSRRRPRATGACEFLVRWFRCFGLTASVTRRSGWKVFGIVCKRSNRFCFSAVIR